MRSEEQARRVEEFMERRQALQAKKDEQKTSMLAYARKLWESGDKAEQEKKRYRERMCAEFRESPFYEWLMGELDEACDGALHNVEKAHIRGDAHAGGYLTGLYQAHRYWKVFLGHSERRKP